MIGEKGPHKEIIPPVSEHYTASMEGKSFELGGYMVPWSLSGLDWMILSIAGAIGIQYSV